MSVASYSVSAVTRRSRRHGLRPPSLEGDSSGPLSLRHAPPAGRPSADLAVFASRCTPDVREGVTPAADDPSAVLAVSTSTSASRVTVVARTVLLGSRDCCTFASDELTRTGPGLTQTAALDGYQPWWPQPSTPTAGDCSSTTNQMALCCTRRRRRPRTVSTGRPLACVAGLRSFTWLANRPDVLRA